MGGLAAIVHSKDRVDMVLGVDALGAITELAAWSVLAIEQKAYRRVKEGPAAGLFSARVQKHALFAVLDWCERDSIHPGPTRRIKLDCLACGACCQEANVLIDESDIERFREAGRPELTTKKYLVHSRDGKIRLRFLPNGRCQHLAGDNKCRVYALRPFNCSVFPVGSEACLAAREGTLSLRDGAPAL